VTKFSGLSKGGVDLELIKIGLPANLQKLQKLTFAFLTSNFQNSDCNTEEKYNNIGTELDYFD